MVAEHNSVLRPLRHLQKQREIRKTYLDLDDDGNYDVETFDRALTPDTALVALTHASNVTGHIYDVAPLFARARAAGAITLLDASQSMGHIPVHADTLHADLIAFPGHKGLRGPVGVGGLYVREGIDLEPIFVGGTGGQSDVFYQPEAMPTRLEAGTHNTPAIAGLTAALHWRDREGEAFLQREQYLAVRLREGLREIPGLTLFDDHPTAEYLPVVSLRIAGQSIEETGQRLMEDYSIICRTGLHCAPLIHQAIGSAPDGTVRLSISGFNTEEDIDYALHAIANLATSAVPALV